jgi:two-component system LytT family response regulator
MRNKLRAASVDDDPNIHATLKQMCKESPLVEIAYTYSDPEKFLSDAPTLDFDLCMLDIQMPGMEGITVAQLLNKKPVIFITGADDRFRDALNLSPVDIVPKPILKDRLFRAIEKAYNMIVEKREYELFNVAESNKKVKIRLQDILFVSTDDIDPRHKQVWLKNGETYTLMNYKLDELAEHSPTLVQVNRGELISLEAVHEVERDLITLKGIKAENGKPKQVTLSPNFKKKFMDRMFYS